MAFFDKEEVGVLTSRLGSDCQAVVRALSTNINVALRNALQAIGETSRQYVCAHVLCMSCCAILMQTLVCRAAKLHMAQGGIIDYIRLGTASSIAEPRPLQASIEHRLYCPCDTAYAVTTVILEGAKSQFVVTPDPCLKRALLHLCLLLRWGGIPLLHVQEAGHRLCRGDCPAVGGCPALRQLLAQSSEDLSGCSC